MLAQDNVYCFSVPGTNSTIEIPLEGLRSLITQVEAELHRSEVYRRAVTSLEQLQTEETASSHFLLKAVGREAIRLALRHFVRHSAEIEAITETVTPEESPAVGQLHPAAEANHQVNDQLVSQSPPSPVSALVKDELNSESVTSESVTKETPVFDLVPGWRKKLSQSELETLEAQQRQDSLRRLGEQVRQARQARSMSLDELHNKTFVPLHQLQAIEAGHGLHLPEDVYLRGFILRIANVLGLDAAKLLESLPAPDPVKSVLPSWYHPQAKSSIGIGGIALRPMHLYFGYAALMTGGFVWLSHQVSSNAAPGATNIHHDSPQVAPASKASERSQKISSSVNVAPPEMAHF